MKPLSPNTLLQNRYLVVQLIGKGGMGEVYLAVDQRLGSAVALKRTFFSDDETLGNAFEREARTLARLRHPVLPKVSDHFTEHDTQYLVMEHISGDDLSKRLEITRKPFPLNWVLFWADQLLDALAYLHSHEPPIVHRDIKPQNLKLTNENHIILLDFGLAKNSTGQTRMTTGGSIVGYTPHYAPMEQIRGTGTTAKSDIYSLSATIYQLLTAQVPPDALTRADSMLNGLPDPVEPISDLNTEVPQKISSVVLKGMSLSADQRYASARDMQKALREAYSELQNKMGAQTVALNAPQQQQQSASIPQIPQSQQMTEQFNSASPLTSQPQAPPPQNYSSQPKGAMDSVSPQPQSAFQTEVLNAPAQQEPDFEMTLRDDALNPTSLPQSQQKTEVLPADVSSHIPKQEENFNPEATMPLISFDQVAAASGDQSESVGATQAVSNYESVPATAKETEAAYPSPFNTAAVATAAGGGYAQSENAFQPAISPVSNASANKKGGKGVMIAGVLGGLLIFSIAAAGIGLYAFSEQLGLTGGGTTTPTPTARPTVSATPTAEPTIEQANTGPGSNTSGIVDTANTQQTTNTQVTDATNRTAPTPTPEKVVVPAPQSTRVVTTAPVRTPAPARTPKPTTPKPGGRTDILQ